MTNSFDVLNYVSVNDIIFVLVFFVIVIYKAKVGLVKSLMPLIALVLSLALAWSFAGVISPTVTDRLYDKFEDKIVENVDFQNLDMNTTTDLLDKFVDALPDSLGSFFQNVVGEEKMTEFTKKVMDNIGAEETIKSTALSATKTVFYSVFSGIIKICIFLLAWFILDLVFKLIGSLIIKTFEMPGLSLLNGIGGAIVGAGEFYLIFWVLKTACETFDVDWVIKFAEGSTIISKFM